MEGRLLLGSVFCAATGGHAAALAGSRCPSLGQRPPKFGEFANQGGDDNVQPAVGCLKEVYSPSRGGGGSRC